jgi:hypothetical protein
MIRSLKQKSHRIKRRILMQDIQSLSTAEPTIRTAQNTADSPVPCTENEAKKKIQHVVKSRLFIKIKVNNINHDQVLDFFDHKDKGKYYLKAEYHGNDTAIGDYINKNRTKFSFLVM